MPDDRAVHSTHSYFLKAGHAARPLELQVDRLRDRRSFSQRQVLALQDGAEVIASLISFHVPEEGLEWEQPTPFEAAPPTSERPYTDYSDVIESVLPVDEQPWTGRPAKADQWLYYEQRVECTSGGRGLASGRFYDSDGMLIATCMQEGLMRWNG